MTKATIDKHQLIATDERKYEDVEKDKCQYLYEDNYFYDQAQDPSINYFNQTVILYFVRHYFTAYIC